MHIARKISMVYISNPEQKNKKQLKRGGRKVSLIQTKKEEEPPLNKKIVFRTRSTFLKKIGEGIIHVVTKLFIGVFHIIREV